ncbi:hypothetical protein SNE40_010082 [Patella caerulea]|uniref:CUB domain-containing protein n=1 Tax=Patella caerulea TaxID=87958 RepID=A0AAN8JSL3_PATCE
MVGAISLNCFLILIGSVVVAGYIPTSYYLTEKCGYTIVFSNDARIRLSRYSSSYLPRSLSCHVAVTSVKASDYIMIKFRDLDTQLSTRCSTNSLKITDAVTTQAIGPQGGFCGFSTPYQVYQSTGDSIYLDFKTNSLFQTGSLDILLTSFNYGSGANSSCASNEFKCSNNKCIWGGLTCDGYNNCGDNSDEISGCGTTSVAVIAGSVGAVVFIIIVLVIIFGARRRYYYHSHGGHC